MMKTSVMRQARVSCVALQAASRVQIAPRTFPSAISALSSTPRALATPCRSSLSPLLRYYSSEAAASTQHDQSPGLITKFAGLEGLGVHEKLVSSITHGMGYEDMTDVQAATINAALDGRDLVAQAKTGTGKTLAFLVPVIQRIIAAQPDLATRGRVRASCDDIRAVIISPTRELAEQISVEAQKLTRNTGVVTQLAVGGTQKRVMLANTQRMGCHLMIGTPGRIHDLFSDPSSGIAAPNLEALVLDEADRMMDVGFDAELREILKYLPDRSEKSRQTLMFSATIPKNVVSLARNYINPNNFEFVQTIKEDEVATHEKVPQVIAPCRGFENMYASLLELIQRETARLREDPSGMPFKAIVFMPTTATVVLASSIFRRLNYADRSLPRSIDIHSKLTQQMRTRNSEDFRKAESAILISSDVTARGLDFPNVTHVIQMHLPGDRDQYIHRLGRTGRAGKEGQGWLLVSDSEVPTARERLPGLPIKRNMDLKCATVDATQLDSQLPEQFQLIKGAVSRLPAHVPAEAYRSLLGGAMKGIPPQAIVDGANDLAIYGLGLEEPPVVSANAARNLGRARGLRIGHVEEAPRGGRGGGFGGRDGGFGGRGGGFGGRGGRSGDRFDAMAQGFGRREGGGGRGFERRGRDSRAPTSSF